MESNGYLAIYLNDHLAGATAVLELVQRAAGEHRDTELGAFLARLEVEMAEDREALKRVMEAVGAHPDPLKLAVAWTLEKLGRLKLNGRLLGRSPLSTFEELETLEIGIYGKLLLWQALRNEPGPGSHVVDLDDLIVRAERQLTDVEHHRLAAAAALAG